MPETATLNVTAALLERGIFFRPENEDQLSIECNWCSLEDYMFYSGDPDYAEESGWVTKAVVHFYAHHENEIKDLAAS